MNKNWNWEKWLVLYHAVKKTKQSPYGIVMDSIKEETTNENFQFYIQWSLPTCRVQEYADVIISVINTEKYQISSVLDTKYIL